MKIDLRKVLPMIGKICETQGVNCLVSRNPYNILYLTGLSLHGVGDAAILITPTRIILFSDKRYEGTIKRIAASNPLIHICFWDRNNPLADVMRFVRKGQNLGFEKAGEFTSYSFVNALKKAAKERGIYLLGTKDIIETVRKIKFPSEIRTLKKAFELTDEVFNFALGLLKPGKTEIEIAYELGAHLRKISGCEELSFPIIVASGSNSATPHATVKNRKLKEGDSVTLDFGLIYDGYHSDMTRTVFIGEPSAKMKQIYNIVLEAQLAVEQQARIGMTGQELDKIARQIITKAGYGKYFSHGTGHGVGRQIHEKPWVTYLDLGKNTLEENEVFSIEPGIYFPRKFGVRIEDVGVLTPNGYEPFNKSSKKLIIV